MQNLLRLFVVCLTLTGASAFGQTGPSTAPAAGTAASAPRLAFDVATIKPSAPLDMAKMAADLRNGQMPKMGPHVEGLLAEYSYMSLRDLIALAYDVKPYQISGPDWLAASRFDITAHLPQGASTSDAPAMLRSLLEDRFKLAAHRTTEEHPVFALVVGKNGPKMKEAGATPPPLDENAPLQPGEMKMNTADGPARIRVSPDGSSTINLGSRGVITQKVDVANGVIRMDSSSISMSGFADMLTRLLQTGGGAERQVVDQTGLKGNYQVSLELSLQELLAMARSKGFDVPSPGGGNGSALMASTPTSGASVFESVEQLGLKLEPRKAAVEQVVVDSMQKAPTDN